MKKINDDLENELESSKKNSAGEDFIEKENESVDSLEQKDELEIALEQEAQKAAKKRELENARIPKGMTRDEYRAQKRKDRIKNFAIAFLAIMLLLTFFSNTIMNVTLPEVATAYVKSDDISPQIRGTGTATSGQPYNVVINQARTIKSVNVQVGAEVKKGDTIYTLEDTESTDLDSAKGDVDKAKDAYELAFFNSDIPAEDLAKIRKGGNISIDSLLKEYQKANKTYQAALKEDEDVKVNQELLDFEKTLATLYITTDEDHDSATTGNTTMSNADIEYQKNNRIPQLIKKQTKIVDDLKTKKSNLLAKIAEITGGSSSISSASSTSSSSDSKSVVTTNKNFSTDDLDEETKKLLFEYENELDKVIGELYQAESKLKVYENELEKITDFSALEGRNSSYYDGRIESEKQHKKQTEKALEDAKTDKEKVYAKIKAELELVQLRKSYQNAQNKVSKIAKNAQGGNVTAPIAGTISNLAAQAGEITSANQTIATIQPKGKALTCSFSVTSEQAKKVKVGEEAQPQNAWAYSDFSAKLTSITNDTNDPTGHKVLNFEINSSEVTSGQSVSLAIGENAVSYDLVVPNSAIRDDNNGKFILVVISKSSPLGNRYIASRVDVQIIAQDDTKSAINGSVENYSYVITTATAPVKAGDQVRLADTNL